jgi:hypothetical protein
MTHDDLPPFHAGSSAIMFPCEEISGWRMQFRTTLP